jgi:hypothetical protein
VKIDNLKMSNKPTKRIRKKTLAKRSRFDQMYCSGNNTIQEAKEEIFKVSGIPPGCQRFIFNGEELESNKTFEYYNIKENDLLHIILTKKTYVKEFTLAQSRLVISHEYH